MESAAIGEKHSPFFHSEQDVGDPSADGHGLALGVETIRRVSCDLPAR